MPDTAGLGDLWIQISRLTERCHVLITTVAYPPGWRVTIRHKDADGPVVTADGEHVLETLAVAVDRAVSVSPTSPTYTATELAWRAASVDSTGDAIIAGDLDGTIEAWNAAAQRLYGYTHAEALGRPIAMLVPPEVQGELDQVMERVRRGERISAFETVRQRKDGSRIHVVLTLSPIMNAEGDVIGSSGTSRDVSERKRMETETLNSRVSLRAILDTAVDAIITIDGRGLIQTVNPATERIFGYAAAELFGQNVKILMPSPYHQEHDGYLSRYKQTGEKRIIGIGREAQARRKDGTVFPIDLAVSEVEPGKLFAGIICDISERKIMEAALRESDRLAAIGSMARGIGHDIGNLLQNLLMGAQMLEKCSLPPKGIEAVQSLRSSIGFLRDLSHGLQQAATDAEDPCAYALRSTRLTDWWPAVAALLRAALRPGVAVESSIPPGLPEARIAPHQLTQAVFYLVSNAVQAIIGAPPAGGGVVKVSATLKPDRNGVRLQVSDNGKGMSPDVLARAFEPLFTTRAGRGGTGLGLALVKRLVTEAGGEVSIESMPGTGTTVTVDLCAAPVVAEVPAPG